MLLGALIFVLLVLVHELGHFLAAKRNGVAVEEFGIGFPPRLLSRTYGKGKNRTKYSLNLLPLGGFVRLRGENESDKRLGSFGAASIGTKTKIALAGVGMNALLAVAIFTILAITGAPRFYEGQFEISSQVSGVESKVAIAAIEESSPAQLAKLERGNIITAINETPITSEAQLLEVLDGARSQTAQVNYTAGGQLQTTTIELADGEDGGILGIVPFEATEVTHNWWVAPIVGLVTALQFALLTIQGFAITIWGLLGGNFGSAAENVIGPVGIFAIFGSLGDLGYHYLFFFGGILSITLAVINILPLPALDGGRLLMSYITHFFKLKLSTRREELIHVTGFIALLVLAVVITFVDIGRL